MANYCSLDEIKDELDIEGDEKDNILVRLLVGVKEFIDDLCKRKFDTVNETRYFDGANSLLFIDDLVSIAGTSDGIFLDGDGDGTFDTTAMTVNEDYILYPLNKTPKTMALLSSNSDYGGFAGGVKRGVKIVAMWGYSSAVPEPIKRASIIQVCRWYKRKDSAFGVIAGSPEMGEITLYQGLDADIKLVLQSYIKRVV